MSLARNVIRIINSDSRFTINEGMKVAINGEPAELTRKGMNAFKVAEQTGKSFGWSTYIGIVKHKNDTYTDEKVEDSFLVVFCEKNENTDKYLCDYKTYPKGYKHYIDNPYGGNRSKPNLDPKLLMNKLAGKSETTIFLDKHDVLLPESERREMAYSRIIHVTGEKVLEKVM